MAIYRITHTLTKIWKKQVNLRNCKTTETFTNVYGILWHFGTYYYWHILVLTFFAITTLILTLFLNICIFIYHYATHVLVIFGFGNTHVLVIFGFGNTDSLIEQIGCHNLLHKWGNLKKGEMPKNVKGN